jgi:hypothetical protein
MKMLIYADKSFYFDFVSNKLSTQLEIFNLIGEPSINYALYGNYFKIGFNVCIFAYGQTGSGKTYTMTGYGDDKGL